MGPIGKFLYDQSPRQLFHFLQRKFVKGERLEGFDNSHPCVFVLSTGRTGTETLAAILGLTHNIFAYHEPLPKLYGLSKLSYEQHQDPLARRILREAFLTTRNDLLNYSLDCGRGYIETGPTGTFLAPIIRDSISSVRFIHLVREPQSVVRSGMRRRWYDGHFNDKFRIVPNPTSEAGRQWEAYDSLQKNLWLWAETNQWIMDFCSTLPSSSRLLLHSEDIFSADEAAIEKLFVFIGAPVPPRSKIVRLIGKKMNAQITGEFPTASDWSEGMTEVLREIAGKTAGELGY
jgi:hypothetical protein